MSKRILSRLRQRPIDKNVVNSDSKSFSGSDQGADPEKAGSHTSGATDKHQRSVSRPDVPSRVPVSYSGVFLGITLIICGAWLFLFPVDMLVEHHRLRYLPSVVEHVTPGTSQFYGVAGVILGLLVLAFSTYSPRR